MMSVEQLKESDDRIKHYIDLVVEQFQSMLTVAIETIDDRIAYHTNPVKEAVEALQSDMNTVKAVLKDTNKDVKEVKVRATKLERSKYMV